MLPCEMLLLPLP